jgi:putative endonuclease
MYFVYILRCRDGTLYTGFTTDPKRRAAEHRAGIGSRYTRSRNGGTLVHIEEYKTRSAALKREAAIKRLPRERKLELIRKPSVRTGISSIGNGLFAMRLFKSGEVVFRLRGRIRHYTYLLRHPGAIQDNAYRFGPETYLSPEGELGDFLNHSCEPNAKIRKSRGQLFVVALRAIPPNTEVVIDYSTILAVDDVWRMRCRCGSRHCRKLIRAFSTLPPELQDAYRTSGIVPEYILRIRYDA